jgi:type I restriction enzyme, R subunit
MRSTSKEHYRPDLVLFVNGIPLCIIECKRPDMKEPLKQAISQTLRNQQEDGIRSLYVYSQLTLSIATQEAAYATFAKPENVIKPTIEFVKSPYLNPKLIVNLSF